MSVTPALVRVTDRDGNVFAGLVVKDPATDSTDAPEGVVGLTTVAVFGADASHATIDCAPVGTAVLPEAASGTFETEAQFTKEPATSAGAVTVASVRADVAAAQAGGHI